MLKPRKIRGMIFLSALLFAFCFVASNFVDDAEARSRGGGRSFSGSKSYSRTPSKTSPSTGSNMNTSRPFGSSSFMRGLGGGIMGGFLGSMLFGGMGHAAGGGGLGGSGIGLFEILIFGGIIYFLYKKFARRKDESSGSAAYSNSGSGYDSGGDSYQRLSSGPIPDLAPPGAGVGDPLSDPSFDQEAFKEFAQDVFFKVQAAWTRRDIAVMRQYLGRDLLSEYEGHFADLKAKGQINKLENIAVRKVEIMDSGEMDGEEFIVVRFTANLLDYTVDEASGEVLEGDSSEPVKFDEKWAFAKPDGASEWKLEGIQN